MNDNQTERLTLEDIRARGTPIPGLPEEPPAARDGCRLVAIVTNGQGAEFPIDATDPKIYHCYRSKTDNGHGRLLFPQMLLYELVAAPQKAQQAQACG